MRTDFRTRADLLFSLVRNQHAEPSYKALQDIQPGRTLHVRGVLHSSENSGPGSDCEFRFSSLLAAADACCRLYRDMESFSASPIYSLPLSLSSSPPSIGFETHPISGLVSRGLVDDVVECAALEVPLHIPPEELHRLVQKGLRLVLSYTTDAEPRTDTT